jgi:hypothetical protein
MKNGAALTDSTCCFKFADLSAVAEFAADGISTQRSAEGQYVARLRPEDDVLTVDSSLYTARLVRPFKRAAQLVALRRTRESRSFFLQALVFSPISIWPFSCDEECRCETKSFSETRK